MKNIAQEMDICASKLDKMRGTSQEFTTPYNNAVNKLDELGAKYSELEQKQSDLNSQIEKQNIKYDKIGAKVQKYRDKINDVNYERQTSQLEQIKKSLNNVGNSISKTVKKVGRWAIAIFGVRSAYLAVSKAANIISQYNEQVGTDLQYIQFGLSMILEPIVKSLINLVYKLLTYVNLIAKAWFNVDLFANSSADKFKKAQKSAEKMKKSLAGFDTVNVLSDSNSSSGTSGIPSFNLAEPSDVPVPSWLKWIMDNKEAVLAILGGIAFGLLSIKLQLAGIQSLGIMVLISGVIMLVQNVIACLNDPTWENFGKIIQSIGVILLGLALIFASIPLAVAGAIAIIVGLVVENWNSIMTILGQIGSWIYNYVIKPVIDFFVFMGGQIWQAISAPIKNVINFICSIKDSILQIWSGIEQILNGDVKGGLNTIFKGLVNIIIDCLNFLIGKLNAVISPIRLLIVGIGKVMGQNWTMDNIKIPKIKKLKNGGIIDVPKTGVPLGQNIVGGEAGPEAVIPLNDETIERIAKYIARYININIDLTTKLDSRVLLRLLKQIQGEQSFARNGG